MATGNKIATQIRLDDMAHKKAKLIAEKEMRSLNSQIEYFVAKAIEEYEKQYGVIALSDE